MPNVMCLVTARYTQESGDMDHTQKTANSRGVDKNLNYSFKYTIGMINVSLGYQTAAFRAII